MSRVNTAQTAGTRVTAGTSVPDRGNRSVEGVIRDQ